MVPKFKYVYINPLLKHGFWGSKKKGDGIDFLNMIWQEIFK
jgi:hypothetical protein